MRDIGMRRVASLTSEGMKAGRTVNLTFRGISDARSSVDRDTGIRIALASAQAVRLWRLVGKHLTDAEKQT